MSVQPSSWQLLGSNRPSPAMTGISRRRRIIHKHGAILARLFAVPQAQVVPVEGTASQHTMSLRDNLHP